MKKKILFISVFLAFSFTGKAQLVINASDYGHDFFAQIYNDTFLNEQITFTSTGGNDVIDCTGLLIGTSVGSYVSVPVSSYSCSASFPQGNYCTKKHTYVDNADYYELYQSDASSYNRLTFGDGTDCQNYYYHYNLPYTYDYYITLITPFATYNNVARNVYGGSGSWGNWSHSEYFTVHPYKRILELDYSNISGNSSQGYTLYKYDEDLSTTGQNNKNPFSIFPNPTNNDFTIHHANYDVEVFASVYDLLGKYLITNEKLNDDFNNISLKDFSPGLYILKITNKENQVLHTEKIIKN
jgi:hypothetical protein